MTPEFPPVVFLDTNILYGLLDTDVMLTLASPPRELFTARWSDYVEQELRRHLPERFRKFDPTADGIRKTNKRLQAMRAAFPDACIASTSENLALARRMVFDPYDAQILADALSCHAEHLITANIKDFDIRAIGLNTALRVSEPGEFLEELYTARRDDFIERLTDMVVNHRHPPRTLQELAEHSTRGTLRGLGGILEREMGRQHAAVRAARPVSGPQGRDRLGRFTAKRGDASDQPDPMHDIWGPDGNGWA